MCTCTQCTSRCIPSCNLFLYCSAHCQSNLNESPSLSSLSLTPDPQPEGSRLACSLASQTHFRKRGKSLVNSIYKPCPTGMHSAPQSRCSILSHEALHHCFSSNSNLENSKREPGHLCRYYRSRKNTSRIVFRERAYPATGNSRVHYLKLGYVIQLIAFRWDKTCIRCSPDPSLSCGSGSGLRD